jgi:hypothetical protein
MMLFVTILPNGLILLPEMAEFPNGIIYFGSQCFFLVFSYSKKATIFLQNPPKKWWQQKIKAPK